MKSITNIKILNVKSVFSIGNNNCEHNWVYDKPNVIMFTNPAKILQNRICDCCGRNEEVLIEGHQAKFETDEYVALKERFSTQQ